MRKSPARAVCAARSPSKKAETHASAPSRAHQLHPEPGAQHSGAPGCPGFPRVAGALAAAVHSQGVHRGRRSLGDRGHGRVVRLAANGTRTPWRTHPAPLPLTRARRTPQLARVLQGREHHRVEAAWDRPRRRYQEGGALGRHGAWDLLRLLGRPDRQAPTTRWQARLGRGRSALRSHRDQGALPGPPAPRLATAL